MADDIPILHQFEGSHFNEKARWALDWKGVRHRRVSHLPGPHALAIRRMSGQTATPVLRFEGQSTAGSAAILERLEQRFPERPLYPAEPEPRRRALGIQDWMDREVGPATRTALFSVMLDEPAFLCALFARRRGPLARAAYRALLSGVRGQIARAHETDRPERVERAFKVAGAALDRVAREVGASGQLVGDTFGVADLTAASLLAPLIGPPHPDIAFPEPVPDAVEAFRARWRAHEAVGWVLDQYARHRPPGAAV